jgi:hypothetical protein
MARILEARARRGKEKGLFQWCAKGERIAAMKWLAALAAVTALAAGQAPKIGDVVGRIGSYVSEYGSRLENVVSEETYQQFSKSLFGLSLVRNLRSDYALTYLAERGWVGYRDTFELEGQPVRGREDRLRRLLAGGAISQATLIDRQNSRFNLANDRFTRTVNLPTLALELLEPRYGHRFSARRISSEPPAGGTDWRLEFRERDRPTIVRTPDGRNQPSRIEVLADPVSGEIHRTVMSWDRVKGAITVEFGRVDGIPVPVPISMVERFSNGTDEVGGDATYANYRRFETSGRVIDP